MASSGVRPTSPPSPANRGIEGVRLGRLLNKARPPIGHPRHHATCIRHPPPCAASTAPRRHPPPCAASTPPSAPPSAPTSCCTASAPPSASVRARRAARSCLCSVPLPHAATPPPAAARALPHRPPCRSALGTRRTPTELRPTATTTALPHFFGWLRHCFLSLTGSFVRVFVSFFFSKRSTGSFVRVFVSFFFLKTLSKPYAPPKLSRPLQDPLTVNKVGGGLDTGLVKKKLQNFLDFSLHRIFKHMHEALNIDENKN